MPIESDHDRAQFLDPDEFGLEAVYSLAGGGPSATINGIFDVPHAAIDGGEIAISDRRPTFLCRITDLPAGASGGGAGDSLTVDGVIYQVVDHEPDGTGMTRLVLGR
jgi:hypothetical protein